MMQLNESSQFNMRVLLGKQYKIENIANRKVKINTSFVNLGLRPFGANKTRFNIIIFYFNIHGKLSIKRCDE